MGDGVVERRPVGTGLASRNDFLNAHGLQGGAHL